jgi:uncharacterized OB-fold protein
MFTKIADSELETITSIDKSGKESSVCKCPKCGALVSTSLTVCPSCKAELEGVK